MQSDRLDSASDTPDRSGVTTGLGAYVLWGFITVYWKALRDFAPLELIGFRITLSSLLLVGVLAWEGKVRSLLRRLRDEGLRGRITLASLLLSINWTTYVVVIHEGKVIEAALGYFIAPLGTMLLGVKVLHERLRPVQLASAGLAAIAVVVLTVSYGRVPVYALAMAASWCLYGLLKRQVPLAPVESLMSETVVLVIPALALVAYHLRYDTSVLRSATTGEFALVALAGVVTAVPLLMFAHASLRLPLTVLGPMQYSVPVINFLLGWLAYHESLTASRIVGFGLVWIALVIVTVDSIRRARASSNVGDA
ncbi:MAG: EamA family transporter RarD [Acidimicrobiia bacterium]